MLFLTALSLYTGVFASRIFYYFSSSKHHYQIVRYVIGVYTERLGLEPRKARARHLSRMLHYRYATAPLLFSTPRSSPKIMYFLYHSNTY